MVALDVIVTGRGKYMLNLHAVWVGTGPGGKDGFYVPVAGTEVMVVIKIKNNRWHLLFTRYRVLTWTVSVDPHNNPMT